MDLVSILVPCYNHEAYLDDCFQSLCSQTYPDIELIITDDCSKDDSFAVITSWEDRLKARFRNVHISKNEHNLGVTKNLNGMLEKAKGMYIKLLASDDMLVPDAIESFVAYAKAHEGADIIFSNIARVGNDTHYPVTDITTYPVQYKAAPKSGAGLTGALCANNYIVAPGVFFPRKTFETYGYFDESYIMEDYEYWLRVSVSGTFAYMDKVTAIYRASENSLSRLDLSEEGRRKYRRFHENKRAVFEKYRHYANEAQTAQFFNDVLDATIGFDDKVLANELLREMQSQKIPVQTKNRVRILFVNVGIYTILKNMKKMIVGVLGR